jgi:NADPH:quinone reductase-like Zn-dependent oxidoreductase
VLEEAMKAIFQVKYGAPDDLELREVDKPAVRDDEVRVRVRAASVHPDVWHVVSGRPYVLRLMGAGFSKPKNPIPGTDMAGIVESVGRSVTRFRRGDEVFGETVGSSWSNGGAFSEYVSVRQDWLALKPDNITFEQAASVPTSGFIALQNLRDPSQLRPGQKVLVNGAGGGVGALVLQLAKAHGAHVTAVDSTCKLSMLAHSGRIRSSITRGRTSPDVAFATISSSIFQGTARSPNSGGRSNLTGDTCPSGMKVLEHQANVSSDSSPISSD